MNKIPGSYKRFAKQYPELLSLYEKMNKTARSSGPMTDREVALVKLAMSVAAGLEGTVGSHTRKAAEMGVDQESMEQVALLALPTMGFTSMMKAWKRIGSTMDELKK